MARYLGLDKVKRVVDIIKANGGILKSLQTLYSRNRWVDYTEAVNLDYDGSQVPPEWHRWLHYMTDDPPTVKKPVNYKWLMDHTPNRSGTNKAYVPYPTTKPKIQAWKPPQ